MFKTLRIVFTVLSALCLVPVVVLLAMELYFWALGFVAGALVFFALVVLFRNLQLREEEKTSPPPPQGDFFAPLPREQDEEDGKK